MMFTCGFLCAIITDLNSSEELITVNTLSGKMAETELRTHLEMAQTVSPGAAVWPSHCAKYICYKCEINQHDTHRPYRLHLLGSNRDEA